MTPIPQASNGVEKRVLQWLSRNRTAIASHDGYPAEFHRQILFSHVRAGSKVAWLLPVRSGDKTRTLQTGRVQILARGHHATCLVTGSSGARPGHCSPDNIVWCADAPTQL